MRAQNGGRARELTEVSGGRCGMAERVTDLQRELIEALLDSGISRALLVKTIDELCTRREGPSAAKFEGVNHEVPPEQTPLTSTPCSIHEQSNENSQTQLSGQSVVEQMLRMDPWQAAKMVKIYMQQHNIPQREVVESTGLNQSHLSQHLNKGTPMRSGKRRNLYSWFERKQAEIQEQYNNISKRPGVFDMEQPGAKKPRRNRFKWGPASANILYQSYEQQRNPSKEEREALVEACNRAECDQRGVSYSNVDGLGPNLVTESRIYNWFANRRKEETFRLKLAIDAANYPADSSSEGHTPPSQALPISQTGLTSPTHHSPMGTAESPTTIVTSPVTPVAPECPQPRIAQTTSVTPSNAAVPMTNTLPAVGTFVQSTVDAPTTLQVSVPPAYQVNGQPSLLVPNTYTMSQPGMLMHTITNMNTAAPMPMAIPQGYHDGMQMHGGVPYQISVGGPIVHMHPVPVTALPVPPPLQPIVSTANTMPPPADLPSSRIQSAAAPTTSSTMQLMSEAPSEFSGDPGVVDSTIQEADSSVKVKMEASYGQVEREEEISVGETVTIVTQAPNQSDGTSKALANSCRVQSPQMAQCLEMVNSSSSATNSEIPALPSGKKSNE